MLTAFTLVDNEISGIDSASKLLMETMASTTIRSEFGSTSIRGRLFLECAEKYSVKDLGGTLFYTFYPRGFSGAVWYDLLDVPNVALCLCDLINFENPSNTMGAHEDELKKVILPKHIKKVDTISNYQVEFRIFRPYEIIETKRKIIL